MWLMFFFFFSSRRRHTRWTGDWSSDVCSSISTWPPSQRIFGGQVAGQALMAAGSTVPGERPVHSLHSYFLRPGDPAEERSEERRVGEEGRCGGGPDD